MSSPFINLILYHVYDNLYTILLKNIKKEDLILSSIQLYYYHYQTLYLRTFDLLDNHTYEQSFHI